MKGILASEVAYGLLQIGAVKFGEFRLKLHETNPDAPLSPIYIDLRIIRSFPKIMRAVADLLAGFIGREITRPDFIADVPTAATPMVAVLSQATGIRMISPRLASKAYGTGAWVDGVFQPGQRQRVLLVDDLITRADSKIEAVAVLTEARLVVEDVLVLIDREQGGRAELEARGIGLHAAFTLRELLEHYRWNALIDQSQFQRVADYFHW